jgi:hypothetical protein
LFARGYLNAMGYVALAFIIVSFGILWLTRMAPERFVGQLDSATVQLLARVFDRALERYLKNMPVVENEMLLHSELAKYIIALAKIGERDEDRMATRGYLKLRSLQRATNGPVFDN